MSVSHCFCLPCEIMWSWYVVWIHCYWASVIFLLMSHPWLWNKAITVCIKLRLVLRICRNIDTWWLSEYKYWSEKIQPEWTKVPNEAGYFVCKSCWHQVIVLVWWCWIIDYLMTPLCQLWSGIYSISTASCPQAAQCNPAPNIFTASPHSAPVVCVCVCTSIVTKTKRPHKINEILSDLDLHLSLR